MARGTNTRGYIDLQLLSRQIRQGRLPILKEEVFYINQMQRVGLKINNPRIGVNL